MSWLRISLLLVLWIIAARPIGAQSFTAIPGGMWIPRPPFNQTTSATFTTVCTADAVGESCAHIFQAAETGNIRSCSFRTGTTTLGSTIGLDIRLETVSATDGLPTGTLVAANTNATHVLNATDDNIWIKGTNFTADAPVTRGSIYACVIVTDATASFTIQGFPDDKEFYLPYHATKVGAGPTWAKATGFGLIFAPEYSDGTYKPLTGVWPVETFTTSTYNSSTATIDERAMEFSFPVTVQVGGAWIWGSMTAAGGGDLIVYSGTTPMSNGTCSFDPEQLGSTGTLLWFCRFPADLTITASATYYLSWKPVSTTDISIQEFDVDTGVGAALMDGLAGGQAFRFASRVDNGAWTAATTTKRPFLGLLVTGISTTATSGGHIIGGD